MCLFSKLNFLIKNKHWYFCLFWLPNKNEFWADQNKQQNPWKNQNSQIQDWVLWSGEVNYLNKKLAFRFLLETTCFINRTHDENSTTDFELDFRGKRKILINWNRSLKAVSPTLQFFPQKENVWHSITLHAIFRLVCFWYHQKVIGGPEIAHFFVLFFGASVKDYQCQA